MTLLFCNIGWMEHYKGLNGNDQIQGGGSNVQKLGHGHEICNFAVFENEVFGYVEPVGKPGNKQISIERLGADKDDECLEDVTVIWTATRPKPSGGTVVIGWYKNATVYRNYTEFDRLPSLHSENHIDGFRVKTSSKSVCLLALDERTFEIPRQAKGFMGTSNVWYADAPEAEDFVRGVKRLLKGKYKNKPKRSKKTDPEKNAKVEKAAIKKTTKYFEQLGYSVDSVEKDNVGWDLEATLKKSQLVIEVKGLSSAALNIELTANEYKAFSKDGKDYRLCIVITALTDPKLFVCRFSSESNTWIVEGKHEAVINVIPKESASIKIDL